MRNISGAYSSALRYFFSAAALSAFALANVSHADPVVLIASRPAVYPPAIFPQYSGEPPAKARMHTCRDQYVANLPSNSNGGLRWAQKGGGYFSECDRRLKGDA
jgi:hypothetical protein